MITQAKDGSGKLLATIIAYRPGYDSSQFYSDPADILQTGTIMLPGGRVVPLHSHNPIRRETVGTAEVFILIYGRARLDLPGAVPNSYPLDTGDVAVIYPGTVHGLTAVEQCRLFEVKNGPYMGKDVDKTLFKEEPDAPPTQGAEIAEGSQGNPLPRAGA